MASSSIEERLAIFLFAFSLGIFLLLVFLQKMISMVVNINNPVINGIRLSLEKTIPKGKGEAILFGSQARGTARPDSDWDVLVILDKDALEPSDYDNITFPLTALGWDLGERISPVMYTEKEWENNKMTPFYKNVQRDGIILWD